jgi:hypothetical protein
MRSATTARASASSTPPAASPATSPASPNGSAPPAAPAPSAANVQAAAGCQGGSSLRSRPAGYGTQRGQWIRERPTTDDYEAAERAYAGDEWQEHICEADFGHALDLASDEEREAWEALELEDSEVE